MSSGDLWDALQRTAPLFDDDHVGELPQVVANMVVSADGATTVAGHVGGLTSESDQTLLHRLRSEADAVLVGSATALAEGYGALLPEGHDYPRGERQPRLVVLTSRPQAFEGEPALEDTGSDIVFVTSPDAPLPASRRRVHRVSAAGGPRHWLRELGVRRLVCEGGPTVLGFLLGAGVIDNLLLALSPQLVRDPDARPLADGVPPTDARLLACVPHDGFVFLRYGFR